MISVIIPTFNRAHLLGAAIASVLAQSERAFELIVVDDGSQDNTQQVVSSFAGNIVYLYQHHQGPAAARNRGIRMAQGELLAFLDSDDRWDRQKLAAQSEEMRQNPSYPISHTQEIWYKNGKRLNQKEKHKKYHGYIFQKCLPLCAVGMSTVVAKRELFDDVGVFDEKLPCCEDYDLWLRVSLRHPFLLVDKPLTIKEGGRPDQVSSLYAVGMDKFRIDSLLKLLDKTGLSTDQRELIQEELEKKCRIYGAGCLKHGKIQEGGFYLSLPQKTLASPAGSRTSRRQGKSL